MHLSKPEVKDNYNDLDDLLMLHAAQALNQPRAQPEEGKSESMRPARPGANKVEKEIAIVNCLGLHLRHAGHFAQLTTQFCSDVRVAKDGTEVNGKSILALLTLGAIQGSRLRVRIEGADAAEAMREIERLIQSWFDDDQIEYCVSTHSPQSKFQINGQGGRC